MNIIARIDLSSMPVKEGYLATIDELVEIIGIPEATRYAGETVELLAESLEEDELQLLDMTQSVLESWAYEARGIVAGADGDSGYWIAYAEGSEC